ncbi:hypothetical protein [Veillonella ratti]|uniref:hypothetical protein n=1 Tax=Veillonella ratti TaxID=103892 RepID=UPI000F8CAE59|nr:hypothetical protein [Veillonella ratti]
MDKANAILTTESILEEENIESLDLDALEEKLDSQLDEELSELQFLEDEKEKIGNPENLGVAIGKVGMGAIFKSNCNYWR